MQTRSRHVKSRRPMLACWSLPNKHSKKSWVRKAFARPPSSEYSQFTLLAQKQQCNETLVISSNIRNVHKWVVLDACHPACAFKELPARANRANSRVSANVTGGIVIHQKSNPTHGRLVFRDINLTGLGKASPTVIDSCRTGLAVYRHRIIIGLPRVWNDPRNG
jgi:hypothetical protein